MNSELNKRLVVILRGPSGSGKSTYGKEQFPTACVCSADKFWERVIPATAETPERVVYDYNPILLSKAHAWCMNNFICALRSQEPLIVVDNTNIQRWSYQAYVNAAKAMNYEVRIIDFRPVTIADIKKCAARNTHSVPLEAVAKMCLEFEPDDTAVVKHFSFE